MTREKNRITGKNSAGKHETNQRSKKKKKFGKGGKGR